MTNQIFNQYWRTARKVKLLRDFGRVSPKRFAVWKQSHFLAWKHGFGVKEGEIAMRQHRDIELCGELEDQVEKLTEERDQLKKEYTALAEAKWDIPQVPEQADMIGLPTFLRR